MSFYRLDRCNIKLRRDVPAQVLQAMLTGCDYGAAGAEW